MPTELNRRGLGAAKVPDGKRASFRRDRALALLFERTISAPCTCMAAAYRCDRSRENLNILNRAHGHVTIYSWIHKKCTWLQNYPYKKIL